MLRNAWASSSAWVNFRGRTSTFTPKMLLYSFVIVTIREGDAYTLTTGGLTLGSLDRH